MSNAPKWYRYLHFWRPNIAADVDAELSFHVDARTEELCASGVERSIARARALREFGDLEAARQTLRTLDERHAAEVRRADLVSNLGRDAKVAVRSLTRSPGLVAVIVLTFALGIGITSAIYSVVDAFLFRPLPGKYGPELVVLARTDEIVVPPHDLSFPDFRDYRADTAVFQSLAAYSSDVVDLNTDRGADRLWIDHATADYFAVLGLPAMLGRTFEPGDTQGFLPTAEMVLSYTTWTTHFGGDSGVVGRSVRINNHPVIIIGVMPPEFHGVRPLLEIGGVIGLNRAWNALGPATEDRGAVAAISCFGRLRAGMSLRTAREAVRLKARQLARAYPSTNKGVEALLVRERLTRPSVTVSGLVPALAAMFMTLVMLVLLVACANIASLLLARVVVRGRELAIRAAMGASQWQLVRQVLVECLLLATIGGIGAVGVAYGALHGLDSIHVATDIPIRWRVSEMNNRVIAFTALVTVLAALAAGIAPASAARRRNLNDVLKTGTGNSPAPSHQRIRAMLVAGQIAISVLVLVSAGLFVRSSANAARTNLGFRSDHLLMLSTNLPSERYDTLQGVARYREMIRRASLVPGVQAVGLTQYVPFGYSRDVANIVPLGSGVPIPVNGFSYFYNIVDGDYFAAMGIPLVEGRTFTDRDDMAAPRVVVINDALAAALWPGQPALGKRFHLGGPDGSIVEIVGIVRSMQDLILNETPKPYIFEPMGQAPRSAMTMLVRTATEPNALARSIRGVILGLDPNLPVFDVRTMDEHLRNGQAFLFVRLGSAFASVFGLLALVLATVGVYGVVSYSVAQRTREIGVRMALGARRTAIVRLIVGQGLRLAWIGVAVGIALSVAATGSMTSVLYGVAPRDPFVLVGVMLLLVLVVGVASLVPARRAMRIDPITSLRSQ